MSCVAIVFESFSRWIICHQKADSVSRSCFSIFVTIQLSHYSFTPKMVRCISLIMHNVQTLFGFFRAMIKFSCLMYLSVVEITSLAERESWNIEQYSEEFGAITELVCPYLICAFIYI